MPEQDEDTVTAEDGERGRGRASAFGVVTSWSPPPSPPASPSPQRRPLPDERAVLERRARFVHLDFPGGVDAMPPELRLLAVEGTVAPGDSGCAQDAPPAWMDAGLFLEGQRVARDNHAGLAQAELLSLFLLFAFPSGLDPLISTSRSDSLETAGRRYLSTSLRVLAWFSSDPFDAESDCRRHLVAVRRMHAHVRAACNNATPDELAVKFTVGKHEPRALLCPQAQLFQQAFSSLPQGAYLGPCPWSGTGALQGPLQGALQGVLRQSPATEQNGFPRAQNGSLNGVQKAQNGPRSTPNGAASPPNGAPTAQQAPPPDLVPVPSVTVRSDRHRRPFLTQGEMAITQWGFFGLFICKPQVFAAAHLTRSEIEALVHMWAVLGYCLGIEDRFNWGLGGLDAVLRRSELYLRMVAVPNLRVLSGDSTSLAHWEHMGRCMVDGMRLYVPMPSFETSVVYLAGDVLGLSAAPLLLRKGLSWRGTLQLWRLRLFLQLLPRWWPSWARWMSRGLRRMLLSKADALKVKA